MKITDHCLKQIDEVYLSSLEVRALRVLSKKPLEGMKEAWGGLKQNPDNSSMPLGSRKPLEKGTGSLDGDTTQDDDVADKENTVEAADAAEGNTPAELGPAPQPSVPPKEPSEIPRKSGKQLSAPGHGRTQVVKTDEIISHYPTQCAGRG